MLALHRRLQGTGQGRTFSRGSSCPPHLSFLSEFQQLELITLISHQRKGPSMKSGRMWGRGPRLIHRTSLTKVRVTPKCEGGCVTIIEVKAYFSTVERTCGFYHLKKLEWQNKKAPKSLGQHVTDRAVVGSHRSQDKPAPTVTTKQRELATDPEVWVSPPRGDRAVHGASPSGQAQGPAEGSAPQN